MHVVEGINVGRSWIHWCSSWRHGESRKKIRRKCEKEREKERKFRNGIVTNFWIVTNSKKE
jgi:hypothetical protein